MVVCKCRKATKLYCFVHKVPVCGECICFPDHQICVVRTYSEWVVDGDYDWPPKCCHCLAVLDNGMDLQTTRLGCLHVMHTNCLVSHIKSLPPDAPPSRYDCPACSAPIWPPKSIIDSGSRLQLNLKEVITQTGLEKNIFGNHPVSFQGAESRNPPPAFASEPLMHAGDGKYGGETTGPNNLEIKGTLHNHDPDFMKSTSPTIPGATTRKSALQVDKPNSEVPHYGYDEDANRKKYSRRGTFRHKLLRSLLPFWSGALPTLPVTAPPRKDATHEDDALERHPRPRKTSRMDPRKILLFIAILACMATMGILYYRIAREMGAKLVDDELQ